MFVDATELPDGHHIDTDVCIVGAGAAGITLAREFDGTKQRVTLLESGGLEYEERTQSLYSGQNVGVPTFDLDENRLRFFGGTTNHWAGHARPLDAIDFEQREWVANSGWPLSRADLEPYYRKAQAICDLGPYQYDDLNFWLQATGFPDLDLDTKTLRSVVYNQSTPLRFGRAYRKQLGDSTNVEVLLQANALELRADQAGKNITLAEVGCIEGPRFKVAARHFVMAAGGMENARLLLLSNRQKPAGLGNDHDLVGRFFMDHILLRPGADVSLTKPDVNLRLYHSLNRVAGGRMFSVLAPAEQLLRDERLNNFRIHLFRGPPHYETPVGGVFSVLDNSPEAPQLDPKVPGDWGTVALHLVLEPTPNPESRLELSDEADLLGQRKLSANWQLSDTDREGAHRAMQLAAVEFGRMGLGRVFGEIFRSPDRWPENLEAGRHHCGTTRMAADPRRGVVDAECRVHEFDNLYIAGSSVFPTIGYANPTLTIVALALRLADHLKERVA